MSSRVQCAILYKRFGDSADSRLTIHCGLNRRLNVCWRPWSTIDAVCYNAGRRHRFALVPNGGQLNLCQVNYALQSAREMDLAVSYT